MRPAFARAPQAVPARTAGRSSPAPAWHRAALTWAPGRLASERRKASRESTAGLRPSRRCSGRGGTTRIAARRVRRPDPESGSEWVRPTARRDPPSRPRAPACGPSGRRSGPWLPGQGPTCQSWRFPRQPQGRIARLRPRGRPRIWRDAACLLVPMGWTCGQARRQSPRGRRPPGVRGARGPAGRPARQGGLRRGTFRGERTRRLRWRRHGLLSIRTRNVIGSVSWPGRHRRSIMDRGCLWSVIATCRGRLLKSAATERKAPAESRPLRQ